MIHRLLIHHLCNTHNACVFCTTVDPNSILVRHRKFLKQLEAQKNLEREEAIEAGNEAQRRKQNFRDQAAKQREKIKGMKTTEINQQNMEVFDAQAAAAPEVEGPPSVISKLTSENVKALSQASSKKPAKKGVKGKPAWAQTAAQMEEDKEAEIDDLLEFAYELDYEKYMEDYEVRQALGIIKDRVKELTQEDDWKEKMAEEWNKANEAEAAARAARKAARAAEGQRDGDAQSEITYQSQASKASKASFISRVSEAKRREAESKPAWDASTTGEKKQSAEDRMAAKIAQEVLRDNPKIRQVHSGASIKVLLEKEAKKQMAIAAKGGEYKGPVISRIEEKGKTDKADPSNLPYLHKNPAV